MKWASVIIYTVVIVVGLFVVAPRLFDDWYYSSICNRAGGEYRFDHVCYFDMKDIGNGKP